MSWFEEKVFKAIFILFYIRSLCPECVPAYSYSHALSLTKDVQQFLVSLVILCTACTSKK